MAAPASREIPLPWLLRDGLGRRPAPVPTGVWGPRGWAWLHDQAIRYPANPELRDKRAAHARLWAFIQNLPCDECRDHATEYARVNPPDVSGSAGYQTWAWRFHNAVNYRLGAPLMSAEDYRRTYSRR